MDTHFVDEETETQREWSSHCQTGKLGSVLLGVP